MNGTRRDITIKPCRGNLYQFRENIDHRPRILKHTQQIYNLQFTMLVGKNEARRSKPKDDQLTTDQPQALKREPR